MRLYELARLCVLLSIAAASTISSHLAPPAPRARVALLQLDRGGTLSHILAAIDVAGAAKADVAVLPEAWLGSGDMEAEKAVRNGALEAGLALVLTSQPDGSNNTSNATLYHADGKAAVRTATRGVPGRATDGFAPSVPLRTRSGEVATSVLLGREHEIFHGARDAMLSGAELLLIAAGGGPLSDASVDTLTARAWENVLGVALAADARGGSAAYLGTKDTAAGTGQTLLPPAPAGAGVLLAEIDLLHLRGNRSDAIWGDAFRRPFAYQPLCGYAPPPPPPPPPAGGGVLKVALLQLAPRGSEEENLAAAERWVREAAAQGADVAVLPEMYSVGYCALCPVTWAANASAASEAYAWAGGAPSTADSPFVARMAALAKELGLGIQASYLRASPAGGPPLNAVALLDAWGELVHGYDKMHTAVWSQCEALTQPGNRPVVSSLRTRLGPVAVGSMICADRE